MFSKRSRYRKSADVTAIDSQGRTLATGALRLLPDVIGTFRHTVEAGDRLDQLAYKYYGDPLLWWTICDANAGFMSPLSLVDQDAIVTTQFPVTVPEPPPWAAVIQALRGLTGVEGVEITETSVLVSQLVTVGGQTIPAMVEQRSVAVLVTHNRLNATAAALATAIEGAGCLVAPYVRLGQVGREIVIPDKPF